MSTEAERIIQRLGLQRLGFEGGFYRENHRSERPGLLGDDGAPRSASTAIYYLLTPESRSMMHRLRSDEVYHFYRGDPVDLLLLHPDGRSETVRLGSDVLAGEQVQLRVPAGSWQGSSLVPGGGYALMGTTMAPGFDLRDFELGRRSALREIYPAAAARIAELTPEVIEAGDFELTAATLDLLHAEARSEAALLAGLGATEAALAWPPAGHDPELCRQKLEAGEPVGWRSWYVLRARTRALVGIARFDGPSDPSPVVDFEGADPVRAALEAWALAHRA